MSGVGVCDLHCDTAIGLAGGVDLTSPQLHVNLPDMKAGGVDLQVFACYVSPALPASERLNYALRMIESVREAIRKNGKSIRVCLSCEDVKRAWSEGLIAALLGVENGAAIGSSLAGLKQLHDAGVRMLTLVHSVTHDWAVSCGDQNPPFPGLSGFGRDVVREMNDLGVIIDVSHAHDTTVEAVLDVSRHPIVASHSCAYSLCPTPRNLRDSLAKAIAD